MPRQGSRPKNRRDAKSRHQARLVHLLNERYRKEFDRAESYRAELRDIQASKLWPIFAKLRQWWNGQQTTSVAAGEREWLKHFAPLPIIRECDFTDKDVSIIIPFRDQAELTEECVSRIRRSASSAEIILIDNGSEETYTRIRMQHWFTQGCKLLHCDAPFNFANLCNLGAAQAARPLLLFLNNDAWPRHRGWLEKMLLALSQEKVGIVGAKLDYPDETIQHVGITPSGPSNAWEHPFRFLEKLPKLLQEPCTVPAVTAACMLIRQDDFTSLNGFDEAFPTVMNDVDLCQRLRAMGKLVAVQPRAGLWHLESLSRGFSVEEPREVLA